MIDKKKVKMPTPIEWWEENYCRGCKYSGSIESIGVCYYVAACVAIEEIKDRRGLNI